MKKEIRESKLLKFSDNGGTDEAMVTRDEDLCRFIKEEQGSRRSVVGSAAHRWRWKERIVGGRREEEGICEGTWEY